MTVLLAVFTDGRRECIEQTIPSALANLVGLDGPRVIFDDSADRRYTMWLFREFGPLGFEVVSWVRRQGFSGSIRLAWDSITNWPDADFVFHLEDDFVFNRPVDLRAMAGVLSAHSHLAQLALRRQPWNDEERAAGGIVESHPEDYSPARAGDCEWLEHRRFFTTNPSIYRRSLCERGWPAGSESEGRFSAALFADPAVRCGFWGSCDSGEWVSHIGRERVGVGY